MKPQRSNTAETTRRGGAGQGGSGRGDWHKTRAGLKQSLETRLAGPWSLQAQRGATGESLTERCSRPGALMYIQRGSQSITDYKLEL